MALLVWLPLVSDIKNKGISDAAISALATVAFNSTGKIGAGSFKSGKADGQVSNGVSIASNFVEEFGDTASVAAWVMPLGNHYHYNGTIVSSGNWNKQKWAFGVSQDNTKVDVLCGNYNTYINCPVPVNEWTHLCSTYDHGVSKLYKNGEYVGELTGSQIKPFESDATTTSVGRETYASGYFGFYGSINDVRIYNHVLSPKEVKEISQGLVCHYKLDGWLDGATENLGIGSRLLNNTCAKTNKYFGNRSTSNGTVIANPNGYNEIEVKVGFGGFGVFANVLGIEVGEIYTYSFNAYEIGCTTPNFSFYPMMYNSSGTRDTTTKLPIYVSSSTTWVEANARAFGNGVLTSSSKRYYCAFEWNQAVQDIIDNGGRIELSIQGHGTLGDGKIYLSQPKIEQGFNKNPYWNPSSDDTEIDKGTTYDSSGYGNSGTNSNSGLSIYNVTQRYTSSTLFDGVNGSITLFTGFKNIVQNPFTINLWFKKDSIGTKAYETLIGGAAGFEMDTRANTSQTLSLYMASTRGGSVFSPFEFGQWYMVTLVNDGTNELYYINGELKKTIAKKSMPTSTYWIGAWSTATKQNYKGLISDFRLYANALSADDVKELYEVSVSIDNFGNVHAYEFVEDGENVSIKKEGSVKALSIDSDPVVWLPLDGNLIDFGSLNSTVSATGATITSGKFSKAYNFDGSNDYLLGTPAPLNNSSDEWSYACWFKPTVSHKGCLYSNRSVDGNVTGITIFYYESKIYVDDGGRWEPSSKDIAVGKWNHVVITRKKGTGKYLYVNGKLSASTSTTNNQTAANATSYLIGMSGANQTVGGNPLNGALCDVRVYSRCLSANEVEQIYAANGFIERGEETSASIGNQYIVSDRFIER